MGKFVDRTGQVFGRLTVVRRSGTSAYLKVMWECVCTCGAITHVPSGSLVSGNTTSCGCFLKEKITKHGGWNSSSYNSWRAMVRRCTNPADKNYPRWGGTGIKVCPAWMSYPQFRADMGEPSGDQTLDRIDPYGDYTPENCRWASATAQARNIRVPKRSTSGVIGVVQTKSGTWMAYITANKRRHYSKVFATIEEAAAARKELERIHWGAD